MNLEDYVALAAAIVQNDEDFGHNKKKTPHRKPLKPLIPRDLLDKYPSWYARWGHSGAMMTLRGKLSYRPGYEYPYFRDHYEAIEARLAELEVDIITDKIND